MKVLFLQHAPVIGGSAISLKLLIEDALVSGWEPHLIVPNRLMKEFYSRTIPSENISIINPLPSMDYHNAAQFSRNWKSVAMLFLSISRTPIATWKINNVIKKANPDIIYLNSSVLLLYAAIFSKHRIPIFAHIRERIFQGYWTSTIKRISNRYLSGLIFISPSEKKSLLPIDTNSIVAYNYIRASKWPTDQSMQFKWTSPSRPLNILSLGGCSKIKGIFELSFLAEALGHQVKIRVVGENFLSATEYSKLSNHLEIAPPTRDVIEHLEWADVLVFWTDAPHFPRPVFEAWLHGVLTIIPKCMESAEELSKENTLIADGDSYNDLQSVVHDIISNQHEYGRILQSAHKTASEKFSEKNFQKIRQFVELGAS